MSAPESLVLLPEIAQIRFSDEDLLNLTRLVYGRLTGLFYRKRYALVSALLDGSYDSMIEIGFGPGIFVPTLAKRCRRLYGLDMHRDMSKVATVLGAHTSNFIPMTADLAHIPVKACSFDAVICMSVLEHVEDLRGAIEEMSRVLKESGVLVLGFPIKNRLTRTLFAMAGYDDSVIHPSSHEDILSAAREGFTLVGARSYPAWMGSWGLYYAACYAKQR